jgi:methionyl-tRNA formyltransferase
VDRRIRACTPGPGAWSTFGGERIKLGPVTPTDTTLPPGVLEVDKFHVLVGTATHAVRLGEVKPHGRKLMAAADWARGARLQTGARFGEG